MNQSALQGERPWEQPLWKPAQGQMGTLVFLVAIHLLAAIGLIFFPLPSIPFLGLAVLFAVLGGIGTTVGYHRTLAHRTLKLNRYVQQVLIFFAMFNGSGAPASWVAYHRQHHSSSDTPDDVSSPKHGGFWWAHLRWLYQSPLADEKRWCSDLDTRTYQFWTQAQAPIVVLSLMCGLPFGWPAFFWMGAIRLVYSLHNQCLVNSVMHLGHSEEGDSSKNLWWLGPFQLAAWGENWHHNHHSAAGSARIGWRWWQVDIGWYFIRAMQSVGLASSVKEHRVR
jgi:fatty-acid desaturase